MARLKAKIVSKTNLRALCSRTATGQVLYSVSGQKRFVFFCILPVRAKKLRFFVCSSAILATRYNTVKASGSNGIDQPKFPHSGGGRTVWSGEGLQKISSKTGQGRNPPNDAPKKRSFFARTHCIQANIYIYSQETKQSHLIRSNLTPRLLRPRQWAYF